MQVDGRTIELGIEKQPGVSWRGGYTEAPKELEAIEKVMDGTLQEGLEQLVTAAREACPNPNCCLTATARPDSIEGGDDSDPMNDTSWRIRFTSVDVQCTRRESGDCNQRANQLTSSVASMAQRCIGAAQEAEVTADKINQKAEKRAAAATSTPTVRKAKRTVSNANSRANRIRTQGETEAQQAREAEYAQAREEIVASLSKE